MADLPHKAGITYFAETDFRGKQTQFGIKDEDRTRHVYVIGKTGMGKSTLLENMAAQDIQNGNGLAFIDPHGSAVDKLLDYVPEHRVQDVIYFAPFDLDYPISFNVLEDVGRDNRHHVVDGLMSAFKKIWVDAWSARMEYILTNILLALIEYPDATLLGVNRMLADKEYRNKVVANVTDPGVKAFWVDEFAKYGDRYMQEAGAAIQNKIGQFTSSPLIRNIIGQPRSSVNFRQAMDDKKILLINLSKGRMGEGNTNLIGSMLITKIYLAAMSRANLSKAQLAQVPEFYFFVDEFQSFANKSFENILSEARKYKLSLTIAHQYVEQMSEEVRAAVFGNVGTTISFRVGPLDAEIFEKIYNPTFTKEDMVNLGRFQMYLTLMIDGVGSTPFSARTIPPIPAPPVSYRDQIVDWTRQAYAKPRAQVEEEIVKWHGDGRVSAPARPTAPPRPAVPASGKASKPKAEAPDDRSPRQPAASTRPAPPPSDGSDGFVPLKDLAKVAEPPRPVAEKSGLSLSALKPQAGQRKSTGKHAADLRDVLKSVQRESVQALPKTKVDNQGSRPAESAPTQSAPAAAVSAPDQKPATVPAPTSNEIPEEVLRKMLDV